jgi:hypothetical protein
VEYFPPNSAKIRSKNASAPTSSKKIRGYAQNAEGSTTEGNPYLERDIYTVIEKDDEIFNEVRLILLETLNQGTIKSSGKWAKV